MFRMAKESDLPVLKEIWKEIFHDSDAFLRYQFGERFSPMYSAVCEESGEIVSCLHGYPLPLKFGEKKVPNVLVSGVATLPEYRGKGVMTKLFGFYLNRLYKYKIPLVSLTPTNPDYYRPIDARPLTNAYNLSNAVFERASYDYNVLSLDISENASKLKRCYEDFCLKYNGIAVREDYFEKKMKEYYADNMKCFAAADKSGKVCGYVIYIKKDGKYICAEAIGEEKAAAEILGSLDLPFEGILPPDFGINPAGGEKILNKNASMGRIVNLESFFEFFPEFITFENRVSDKIISANNKCDENSISVGDLLELAAENKELPYFTADLY